MKYYNDKAYIAALLQNCLSGFSSIVSISPIAGFLSSFNNTSQNVYYGRMEILDSNNATIKFNSVPYPLSFFTNNNNQLFDELICTGQIYFSGYKIQIERVSSPIPTIIPGTVGDFSDDFSTDFNI